MIIIRSGLLIVPDKAMPLDRAHRRKDTGLSDPAGNDLLVDHPRSFSLPAHIPLLIFLADERTPRDDTAHEPKEVRSTVPL
jgi:hypothetical protein